MGLVFSSDKFIGVVVREEFPGGVRDRLFNVLVIGNRFDFSRYYSSGQRGPALY